MSIAAALRVRMWVCMPTIWPGLHGYADFDWLAVCCRRPEKRLTMNTTVTRGAL